MKGEVRGHEHISLEDLAAVEDMAATAQRGRAERIHRRIDLEIWTTEDAFWQNSQIANLGSTLRSRTAKKRKIGQVSPSPSFPLWLGPEVEVQ